MRRPAVLLPAALAALLATFLSLRILDASSAFLAGARQVPRPARATALPRPAVVRLPEQTEESRAWAEKNFVDETKKFSESSFPISPSELIRRARRMLALNGGFPGEVGDLLADDFEFAGPVVGPMPKEHFLISISDFNFMDAFPDANYEMYDFRVDPFEPNRVWFTSRGTGTQTGTTPNVKKPTGKGYVNPPQACSITFNEEGKATQYTVGYVMDRRVGNTGGLGGLFGIMYAAGSPLPYKEAKPFKPSLGYRFRMWLANFYYDKRSKERAAEKEKEASS